MREGGLRVALPLNSLLQYPTLKELSIELWSSRLHDSLTLRAMLPGAMHS